MIRAILLVIFLLVITFAAAGCSSKPEPVELTIEMTEFAFEPPTVEAKVGQTLTIHFSNQGALEHEVMIGKDLVKHDNRPNGYEEDLFQAAGIQPKIIPSSASGSAGGEHAHAGTMVVVPPGGQAALSFTVTRAMVGEWEMGCFSQQGVHYAAGMVGSFSVAP